MYESFKAGKILDLSSLPTLSDGSAGGVDPDAVSQHHCSLTKPESVCFDVVQLSNCIIWFLGLFFKTEIFPQTTPTISVGVKNDFKE